VGGKNETVVSFALQLRDLPSKNSVSHGNGGDEVRLASGQCG
jgi:hypothetical protein